MRRQLEGIRLAMRSGLHRAALAAAVLGAGRRLLGAARGRYLGRSGADHRGSPARATGTCRTGRSRRARPGAGGGNGKPLHSRSQAGPRRRRTPRIAALVGPPGSGKTTTLVKLAVAHGLAARKSVQLISLDNLRVGGRRATAFLRGHPGSGISGRGDTGGAGAGARRSPLEVSHSDRHTRVLAGGYGWRGGSGARLSARSRNRYPPGPIGVDEIRRSNSCGGSIRDLPAVQAAVYQTG